MIRIDLFPNHADSKTFWEKSINSKILLIKLLNRNVYAETVNNGEKTAIITRRSSIR